ncbi:MAG TPA: DNA polymerase III subunit alpha, partial [Acidimicrobiales bacterium]|nr:DNA polymerase III subunit alpha [Acidimicrobiales bacterium]
TEFSMLDGAARLDELVAKAVADGQPAIGITDHGNMYGTLEFYKECRKQGVKPVIGTEAYMAHDHRSERPTRRGRVDDSGGDTEGGKKLYYHLTLLAESDRGYRNLIHLSSKAFLEGYYYKPRLDWELLAQHSDGLIATTGCLGGHVLQSLLQGDERAALEKAGRLQEIFGRDNLFVELQDHGLPAQRETNPKLIELAKRLRAPLLATNDSHYTHREDHEAHDALLCVQTGAMLSDPKRFKFEGHEHYLKTSDEMRYLFRDHPEACDNTLWIAERADVTIEFGDALLPNFPLPEGFADDTAYLEHVTWAGVRERWGDDPSEQVKARIQYELDVIAQMGFSSYFLIVWDLISYARSRGIRVGPGRGSAAGCAVAYSLRITDLDPIRYDLIFERFLNPSRVSMPDIDMDFDSRYRDEMIRYAAERYGRDHVAQIVTFSTIKARAAVRDAARVLGLPYLVGDKVAKAMPPLVMGRDTPLYACLEQHPKFLDGYQRATDLRNMYAADPDVKRVVDVAKSLEGLRRQDGIHAAAVVITDQPLTEYLPIQRKPLAGGTIEDAPVVTQYEMGGVEELGLLKMDFLGLRNLDVITDALALIKEFRGDEVDIDAPPLDDEATFAMLRRGDSIGVFQMEGGGLRQLLRLLAPTTFEDVAALVALYRPGPMGVDMHIDYAERKNGRKPVEYFHPDAEEILTETYGLMIYQESVMRVSQQFAGYSLADADNLRKACGKKNRDIMAKERSKFVEGCEATGYGHKLGTQLFDTIENFADYAFNKSHSFGYGFVAYQTAYLKANYRIEYLAALLTSVKTKLEKAAVYLNECRISGIKVLVADVNRSHSDFVPTRLEDGTEVIPFGLSAVRNLGSGLVDQMVAEREANGPFTDFYDFCDRVPLLFLNKRTMESLIKAGGFDSLGHPRKGLLQVFEVIIDMTLARRRQEDQGVMSLFDDGPSGSTSFDDRPEIPGIEVEFEKTEKLKHEKEMLGLYVSDHPIMGLEDALRRRTDCSLRELIEQAEATDAGTATAPTPAPANGNGKGRDKERSVKVGGVITNLQHKFTRANARMAVFVLEDLEAALEVTVFPRTFETIGHVLADDLVVTLTARLDTRDDQPKLIAMDVTPCEDLSETPPLRLRVPPHQLSDQRVKDLKDVLVRFPGESIVYLHVGEQVVRLPDGWSVEQGSNLLSELRAIFGADCLVSARALAPA